MTLKASDLASGKDHKGENFPVASWLVRPDARADHGLLPLRPRLRRCGG
jgi:hypothetical protein